VALIDFLKPTMVGKNKKGALQKKGVRQKGALQKKGFRQFK
jgi:hypothetical protein